MLERLIVVGDGGFSREVAAWAQDAVTRGTAFALGEPLSIESAGSYDPDPQDRFVLAVMECPTRTKLAQKLRAKGWTFGTFVHPSVIVGPRVTIGVGSILCPYCAIACDIEIGAHVVMNLHATVGSDSTIGEGCTLSPYSAVSSGCQLAEGVFMGTHAATTPGLTVGAYSVIGAGSTVVRNVDALATVVGVPAKKIYGYGQIVDENWTPWPELDAR